MIVTMLAGSALRWALHLRFNRFGSRLAGVGFLASVLAACGEAPPPAPVPAEGPSWARPCDFLTEDMTSELSERPYFRTIVRNAVEDGAVTCARAVGAGGVDSIARVVAYEPRSAGPSELLFAALCRGDMPARLTQQDAHQAPAPDPPTLRGTAVALTPALAGQACALPGGGVALHLGDRVVEVAFEQADGSINGVVSVRLAEALAAADRARSGGQDAGEATPD